MERRGGFRPERFSAPVNVGDELDVKIESVGEKGDGIARKDGFILFVPGAKEGDEVHIKVTKVLAKVGFAELAGKGEAKEESQEGSEEKAEETAEESSEKKEEEAPVEDTEDFGEEEERK